MSGLSETPHLDRFIAKHGKHGDSIIDGVMSLRELQRAHDEADKAGLLDWAETIYEYVYALESGKGLNRPL